MEKRWKILPEFDEETMFLQNSLKINPVLCRLLVQRNIHSFEQSRSFFRPQLSDLHDPFLMKDMDKAVSRIQKSILSNEKVLVYGDYDVDGTTSVACMYRFLSQHLKHIDFYIPNRYLEGYGISKQGIDFAAENQFKLIIALDCGIKSVEMVRYAKEKDIEFIICDHHLPDVEIPAAVAILNAKQAGCPYPFKELCGCGVGFKLIQALCTTLKLPEETWHEFLDLVAIAIAADIVPMVGENRVLTFFGLQLVNQNPSIGVKALMKLAKMEGVVQVSSLVFVIAPRVNAAGRMDEGRKAVELFTAKDENTAMHLAEQLHLDNTDRREIDSSITEMAIAMIESDPDLIMAKSTVLFHEDWGNADIQNDTQGKAKGVVGIVASRLIEKYYRPTILLTGNGDKVSGSARSVFGFNVHDAIDACSELLENFGGHFYAAGLTLKKENVILFRKKFEEIVSRTITEEMLTPHIVIDSEINFEDITPTFYSILTQMEPFGPENMRPVFMVRGVTNTGRSRIVKDAHIKFELRQQSTFMSGIGFGLAEKFSLLESGQPFDIACTLDENIWNGQTSLQLKVIDIKPSVN